MLPQYTDFSRFWSKVSIGTPSQCWLWTAFIGDGGYGQFSQDGKLQKAHRVAYTLLVGDIPVGLTLDHLCRTRSCVNPNHLEPVTQRENLLRGEGLIGRNARKTHCNQGHPFNEENTYRRPSGNRDCRQCRKDAMRRYYRKKIEELE